GTVRRRSDTSNLALAQCAGGGLVLSSRRGLQPARPVLSGQGSAGGRAKRALDRAGSVWLPPGELRGEGQPGPCLSEAVPGAGRSPAGARGSAPATPGRAAAGSRGSALCREGTLAAGQAPGRGEPDQAGWSLLVMAVTSGGWSPAALPVAFLIPTGRAPRGKATPEGPPALPLLRAPGRAGIRRRGEQQSRGTVRSAAAIADLVDPLAGDLGGLGERGG